jgi:hypothetical protein
MYRVRTIGAAIVAVVALSAIASATASAALPEFLPASGKFTSTAGAGTLQIEGGNTITCTEGTNSGEITGAKTATVTITFKGCRIFGFIGAHSSGDVEGTILVSSAKGELCYLSKTAKTVGLKLTLASTLKIEAGGQKSEVLGTLIGEVKPVNSKVTEGELILKQTGGLQAIKKCEGGTETELKANENGGAFKAAGEQTTDKIQFTAATEVMA